MTNINLLLVIKHPENNFIDISFKSKNFVMNAQKLFQTISPIFKPFEFCNKHSVMTFTHTACA